MSDFRAFDSKKARRINVARMNHLASLGLSLEGKRVLEPGSGIGLLTGFFEERGCAVFSTDGRKENVKENLRRHPGRVGRVDVVDLMVPGSHDHLANWDIVFCYGTLYHMPNPNFMLEDLARVCDEMFLLETMVHPQDNGKVHSCRENKGINQGLYKKSCRPARDWVMNELAKHFKHVYVTRTQPNHFAFPLEWPPATGKARSIFVASRKPLRLPSLSDKLLRRQERMICVPS